MLPPATFRHQKPHLAPLRWHQQPLSPALRRMLPPATFSHQCPHLALLRQLRQPLSPVLRCMLPPANNLSPYWPFMITACPTLTWQMAMWILTQDIQTLAVISPSVRLCGHHHSPQVPSDLTQHFSHLRPHSVPVRQLHQLLSPNISPHLPLTIAACHPISLQSQQH